jgi:hypothetical protein
MLSGTPDELVLVCFMCSWKCPSNGLKIAKHLLPGEWRPVTFLDPPDDGREVEVRRLQRRTADGGWRITAPTTHWRPIERPEGL